MLRNLVSRDSLILYLGAAIAAITYLLTADKPPTEWDYKTWLNAASLALAWLMGKLQTSPLDGAETVARRQAALKGHAKKE